MRLDNHKKKMVLAVSLAMVAIVAIWVVQLNLTILKKEEPNTDFDKISDELDKTREEFNFLFINEINKETAEVDKKTEDTPSTPTLEEVNKKIIDNVTNSLNNQE